MAALLTPKAKCPRVFWMCLSKPLPEGQLSFCKSLVWFELVGPSELCALLCSYQSVDHDLG